MPRTSRPIRVHPVTLREARVLRVDDLTSGMRRLTLGGDQLEPFVSGNGLPQPGFASTGFDDDIRLVFPYPGEADPVLPVQADGHLNHPKDPRPLSRIYTVRRFDPVSREITVDFVAHGVGAATSWAYRAQPGDRIHFYGPFSSKGVPDADWLLIAGDDTALPAISRLLEDLPETARAQVFIEIADDAHRQTLRELPGVEVTWLVRHGAAPGTTTLLHDAVRSADWWEGRPFAWVAGEQATVRDLRRHLVEQREMPKEDIDFTGYWKRETVVTLDTDAAVPDPERSPETFQRFHDLVDLVPPLAIRAAAGIGIGDLISRGFTTVSELATRTGSDERALGKLLRYLRALEILSETAPGHYALTEVGEFLADPWWAGHLDPDGAHATQSMGLFGLAESLRTGKASYAAVTGREFTELRSEQAHEDAFLDSAAEFAGFLAEPLAKAKTLNGIKHLVIHSDSASIDAREIIAAHPDLRVTIIALPAQVNWLRRDLPATIPDPDHRDRIGIVEQSIFESSPASDAVLLLGALAALSDGDAAHALRHAADNLISNGRVRLGSRTYDTDRLDEHDGEADLIALTRDGTGMRTPDELHTVIADAGLHMVGTETIGWGLTLRELAPTT